MSNKRSHLRWLIPVLCYFAVLTIALISYWNYTYRQVAEAKETDIAFDIERAIDVIDLAIEMDTARVTQISRAVSLYGIGYNRNQITSLLKNLVEETDLSYALVCNLDGEGYDMNGRDLDLSTEPYFSAVSAEYSRGGIGMMLPDGQADKDPEVMIVSGISFEDKEKGYLIAKVPVIAVSDQLFRDRYVANRSDIVTIDGDIITFGHNKKYSARTGVTRQKLWNNLPEGVSKDTIKLSISQRNVHMSRVDDYGYVIVVPFSRMAGGVVTFITEDEMRQMIKDDLHPLYHVTIWVVLASLILLVAIFAVNAISDLITKRTREKILTAVERDVVTGLMTRASATRTIENYLNEPGEKRGIVFVIGLNSTDDDKNDDAFSGGRLKEFARSLEMGFRATDILGRISDREFLVFLKDIHEEKDVRKQTDHMQMFLHDVKVMDGHRELSANAGAALFPDSGKDAHDIIMAAENALIRSRKDGTGRLSF